MSVTKSVLGFPSRDTWITSIQEYCLSGAANGEALDRSIELCSNPSIKQLLVDFQVDDNLTRKRIMPLIQQFDARGDDLEASALLALELLFLLEPIKEVSGFDNDATKVVVDLLDIFLERLSKFPLLLPNQCMANYLKGTLLLSQGMESKAQDALLAARMGLMSLDSTAFPSANRNLNTVDGNLGALFIRIREPVPAYYHLLETEKRLHAEFEFTKSRHVYLHIAQVKAHQSTALSLMGDEQRSFDRAQQAISIFENTLSSEELSIERFYSNALNTVALFYYNSAEYTSAKKYLLKSQAVLEKARAMHPLRHEDELYVVRFNLVLIALKLSSQGEYKPLVDIASDLFEDISSKPSTGVNSQLAAALANVIGETIEKHKADGADRWYNYVRTLCQDDQSLNSHKGGLISSFSDFIVQNIDHETLVYQGLLNILSDRYFTELEAERNLIELKEMMFGDPEDNSFFDVVVFCLHLGPNRGVLVGILSAYNFAFEIIPVELLGDLSSFEELRSLEDFFQRTGDLGRILPLCMTADVLRALEKESDIYFCGDQLAISLPWELISTDPSTYSPLGLQSTLPRIADPSYFTIRRKSNHQPKPSNEFIANLVVPYDTVEPSLTFSEYEIDDIVSSLKDLGVEEVNVFQSTQATFLSFGKLLLNGSDILYFSGHGGVLHGEDSLILHHRSDSGQIVGFGHAALKAICEDAAKIANTKMPRFVYLNSCITGRSSSNGGPIKNLPGLFLQFGSEAILSVASPVSDFVASEFSQVIFEGALDPELEVGELVLRARRRLFEMVQKSSNKKLWREWARPILYGDRNLKITR